MDWFTFLIPISWFPACDFLLSVGGVFYCLAAALGSQGDIVARIASTARERSANTATGTCRLSIFFSPIWPRPFTIGI